MTVKIANGNIGENFVINNIPCPSCNKKLILLPKNFPLYDLQCSGCNFRAQVKYSSSKPGNSVAGGGWDIMHKNLKSGHLVPPMFIFYNSKPSPMVHFYPFICSDNIQKAIKALPSRPTYYMCRFIKLDQLARFEYEF